LMGRGQKELLHTIDDELTMGREVVASSLLEGDKEPRRGTWITVTGSRRGG